MLTEKKIQMTADDWYAAGEEARSAAVAWLCQEDPLVLRSMALANAAEMLRAADAFFARYNIPVYVEDGADEGTIEVDVDEAA